MEVFFFFFFLFNEAILKASAQVTRLSLALLSTWGCLAPPPPAGGGGLRADRGFCSGEWIFPTPLPTPELFAFWLALAPFSRHLGFVAGQLPFHGTFDLTDECSLPPPVSGFRVSPRLTAGGSPGSSDTCFSFALSLGTAQDVP